MVPLSGITHRLSWVVKALGHRYLARRQFYDTKKGKWYCLISKLLSACGCDVHGTSVTGQSNGRERIQHSAGSVISKSEPGEVGQLELLLWNWQHCCPLSMAKGFVRGQTEKGKYTCWVSETQLYVFTIFNSNMNLYFIDAKEWAHWV